MFSKKISAIFVSTSLLSRDVAKHLFNHDNTINLINTTSNQRLLRILEHQLPDVILFELTDLLTNELKLIKRVAVTYKHVNILVLSSFVNAVVANQVFKAGAKAYLTLDASWEEIQLALQTCAQGKKYVPTHIAQLITHFTLNDELAPTFKELSEQEFQIFLLMVRGNKTSAIAETCFMSEKTVNSYCQRIFDKFRTRNKVILTHIAYKYGFI
ncbi:MAG: response regulator transcription factor [Gammaproteobacteria bacterium]